jgi:polysaccharide biosynthesis transport protein
VRLSAIYTENHPDLRAAKRKVESLEQATAAESATPSSAAKRSTTAMSNSAVARIDRRIAALRDRLKVIDAQRSNLRGRLGQMDVALVKSPQVERGLAALTRDYQNAQKKYEEIVAKRMTAQVAENLEEDQKAERFAVLEPPTLPDRPVKPDRRKLLAFSLILAMVAPVGLVSVMETLHGTVRGVGQISAILGQKPLVTVPLIPVAAELASRRKTYLFMGLGALLVIGLILVAVHFLVLPLDMILMKTLIRLG